MILFSLFFSLLFMGFYVLLEAWFPQQVLKKTTSALFLALLSLIYSPQLTSLLFSSLNIVLLTLMSLLMLFGLAWTVRAQSRINILSVKLSSQTLFCRLHSHWESVKKSPYLLTLVVMALLGSLFVFWIISQYSNFHWDGWTYHSSAMAWFHQHNQIKYMPLMEWATVYPKNIEFLSLWVFKFDGIDTFLEFPNLLIHLLVLPFAFGLARRLGLNKQWALAAALIYFCTPAILEQSWTTYIDQAFADGLIMLLYFFFEWRQASDEERFRWAILIGFSLGYLAQIKGTGLYIVVILGLLIFLDEIINKRFNKILSTLVTIGIATAITGAGWYLYNWVEHGNPFHPFQLAVPGTGFILFEGIDAKNLLETAYRVGDMPIWKKYIHGITTGSWGLHFLVFLPCIFIAFIKGSKELRILVGFAVLYAVLTPLTFMTRYSFVFSFVGAVCFALFVQEILNTRHWSRILQSISILAIVASMFPLLKHINPSVGGLKNPPLVEDFSKYDGFRRFALVNEKPGSHVALVNLETNADNPLWYYYFGPKWENIVDVYDANKSINYDFIICGVSSKKCDDIRQLSTHKLVLSETNIEVFQRRD